MRRMACIRGRARRRPVPGAPRARAGRQLGAAGRGWGVGVGAPGPCVSGSSCIHGPACIDPGTDLHFGTPPGGCQVPLVRATEDIALQRPIQHQPRGGLVPLLLCGGGAWRPCVVRLGVCAGAEGGFRVAGGKGGRRTSRPARASDRAIPFRPARLLETTRPPAVTAHVRVWFCSGQWDPPPGPPPPTAATKGPPFPSPAGDRTILTMGT